MKTLNRRDFPGARYSERIIQFGEGNFLRAFVDWQVDLLNEHTDLDAGVVIVRPIESDFPPSLNTQDGLYTTIIRGLNGPLVTRGLFVLLIVKLAFTVSMRRFSNWRIIRISVLFSQIRPKRASATMRAINLMMRQR